MLREHEIEYRYREYTEEPLSESEIRELLAKLALEPHRVLRKRDPAYRELGLSNDSDADELVRALAEHPTLLERPIVVRGNRAVVGRPPENLLELASS